MKHTPYTGKSELNSTMAVTAVGVAISSYYADGLLESCKDVQFPSNNQKVGDCVKVFQLKLCGCVEYKQCKIICGCSI